MSRIPHSDVIPLDEVTRASVAASQLEASSLVHTPAAPDLSRFDYLFPNLQTNPANLLPESPQTVQALKDLGSTMSEPGTDNTFDSSIPSAYTYFGQFIDHDTSLMIILKDIKLNDPNLAPLTLSEIDKVKNVRTSTLDLDSVYGEAPHVGDDLMLLGTVAKTGHRPPGRVGDEFDLPRTGRSRDRAHDRAARIGDRRNEENTMTAQLHVAFLRAHNAIVAEGYTYCEARSLLRRYYHLIVAHDFLEQVAEPAIVNDMLSAPWQVYNPPDDRFFMPIEFSAAAFRFGHSMVRAAYDINEHFPAEFAPLLQLFNVLGPYPSLPEEWLIQWENFVEGGTNKARQIDTQLVAPLFTLPGLPLGEEIRLAVRTLLRGYILRLPTGQAVARSLGLHIMTAKEIEGVAANENQLRVLQDSGFSSRTPLWFYILAEAAYFRTGRLGPVGSTLVAGVLIALIRRSKDSVLKIPGGTLAPGSKFKLPDLLRLARVL
jgi:hypothetical protein